MLCPSLIFVILEICKFFDWLIEKTFYSIFYFICNTLLCIIFCFLRSWTPTKFIFETPNTLFLIMCKRCLSEHEIWTLRWFPRTIRKDEHLSEIVISRNAFFCRGWGLQTSRLLLRRPEVCLAEEVKMSLTESSAAVTWAQLNVKRNTFFTTTT
jgi:hypothetical protein